MKKSTLMLFVMCLLSPLTYAGTTYSGKEMKQVAAPPPPCPWYADNEFNVSLWGTYIFTGNNWQNDRYLLSDHAWGGGIDAKYFFHRYFGVGVEGWMVDSRQARENDFVDVSDGIFQQTFKHTNKGIGAVLGTLTLRYPIACTRFSPYIFGGGGGIFGGGQRPVNRWFREKNDRPVTGPGGFISNGGEGFDILKTVGRTESESLGIGQVGGGMEIRLTPHVGWVSDFSWNFVSGPKNNFGMVRTGVNFAF
jgi:hypothetical protein